MRRLCCGTGVLVALVFAGCGEDTIDSGSIEDRITEDAQAAGIVLDEVECPEPEAKKGESFVCRVTVKGEQTDFQVKQLDDEGSVEFNDALAALYGPGGGDEASVRSVIDAVNADVTALCDYATDRYKAEIVDQTGGRSCQDAVAGDRDDPIRDYEVAFEGDTATVTGTDSNGEVAVNLERAEDGTWEISGIR